jgi:hypothetical protein
MKQIALILLSAIALSACTTTGQLKPNEMLLKACPIVRGTMLTLAVTDGITDKTKAALKEAEPIVDAACAAPQENAHIGINVLTTAAIPLLQTAISESSIGDDKKQAALIALVAAQVIMAGMQ